MLFERPLVVLGELPTRLCLSFSQPYRVSPSRHSSSTPEACEHLSTAMGPSPRNSRNLSRVAAAPYATRATRASTQNTSILIDSDLDMSDDEDVNSQMMPQLPKMREICTPEQKKLLQEFFIRTSGYPTKAQKAEISRRINKYVHFGR